MCKVRDARELERGVVVFLNNGKCLRSDWYNEEDIETEETDAETIVYKGLLTGNDVDADKVESWIVIRNMDDEDTVYITEHAMTRMKERCGWNRKTAVRMMKKVYDNGKRPEEIKGRIGHWVRERMARRDNKEECRLYGEHLFVFKKNVLITVLVIPRKSSLFSQEEYRCAI